ncbi:beta-glucosidase 24-like isoform X2 [Juglans microcarpa x Juglans regia]|uniref:beta-glucosidase 24-like isoform X2 n=1 Tax=Juglans microcarpa x Juglans regia TaxID=2249226 RepID=UPI001B7EA91F|nr:beta-glucosidase 24-like isoform X2 [Juglans microcarpa x Juglans regia]
MAMKGYILIIGHLVLVSSFVNTINAVAITPSYGISTLNRTSFPKGFTFGAGSADYQVEGATPFHDGKGESMWDYYTHKYPEKIADGSNGDVASEQYHRFKEDFGLLKDMNGDAYRFSLAWTRLIPTGKISDGVNQKGIDHYNQVINELLAKGLTPYVTIFHWHVPMALDHKYGGFLSQRILEDFKDYAELCFKEFGDRVKHWTTVNEPHMFTNGGYAAGVLAPFRCSSWQNMNCTGGDSATEPYIVAHNLLLAHAVAANLYKTKYQAKQKGVIGITVDLDWMVPYSQSEKDRAAALRAIDFRFGWFMDPLTKGRYPLSMRTHVRGNRLPMFTPEQSKLVKGSYDFIGLNYYTANYVADVPEDKSLNKSYLTDALVIKQVRERDGVLIGPQAASDWLYVYPRGIYDLLVYTKTKYGDPVIYITENGINEHNNASIPLKEALVDTHRIDYHYRHLAYVHKAIGEGVRVKGYFAWSFSDTFEWFSGYTIRFGIHFIDFENGLKRHPKLSAQWFKNFLKK